MASGDRPVTSTSTLLAAAWSRLDEARLLDRLEAAVAASLLAESTDAGRALPVRACADQPDPV